MCVISDVCLEKKIRKGGRVWCMQVYGHINIKKNALTDSLDHFSNAWGYFSHLFNDGIMLMKESLLLTVFK